MNDRAFAFDVRKTLVAVLLIAGLALCAIVLAPADAFAAQSCKYYSDATYTTVVGGKSIGCCGETSSWGQVTPYRRCQILYCLDVQCPQ